MKKYIFILVLLALQATALSAARNISLIPTDSSQPNFVAAYRYALQSAHDAYKSEDRLHDTTLFSRYGQLSVYMATSGANSGRFVVPMRTTAALGQDTVASYDWTRANHVALQYKMTSASVLVFQTKESFDGYSASSGADQFSDLFESYFWGSSMHKMVNEESLQAALAHADARLLIIPDFAREENSETYFADLIATKNEGMKLLLQQFLQRGGTIYAEGNGGYLLQALGLLNNGTLSYAQPTSVEDVVDVSVTGSQLLSFAAEATDSKMYLYNVPKVNATGLNVLATYRGDAVLFERQLDGGKLVVNTGMPTFAGLQGLRSTEPEKKVNDRQAQWFLNVLLYAHAYAIDATRKVRNEIKPGITASPNSVPFDDADEFEVLVTVRNLSSDNISLDVTEVVRAELTPVLDAGGKCGDFSANGQMLTATIDVPAKGEKVLRYYLRMPIPNATPHDRLNDAISTDGLLSVTTESKVSYTLANQQFTYSRQKALAYVMLSADLYCDIDVNWKNPVGTFYQPFKVFMNVENKGRTAAKNVVYEQLIPIDMPVYWVDATINIPVLRTAGGKFVDVLRGVTDTSDKNLTATDLKDHDLDFDGKPDVWLDQSSIYPKGYTLTDTLIYWRNAWDHFRGKPWLPKAQQQACDPDSVYWFEDINHNGVYTCYKEGRGFYGYDSKAGVEVAEDTGDKLRSWKVTWNINTIPGLQTFEPFMSYEIWIDVPNLPQMAAGVAKAYGEMAKLDRGDQPAVDATEYYYFPYHSAGVDIPNGDIDKIRAECPECDERWKHWMNTDDDGDILWRRFVHTQRYEYKGYKWVKDGVAIDSSMYNGTGKPYEDLYGTTPVPRDAFNLMTSLGGEDIDMDRFFSKRTEPSRVKYETIFGEKKTLGMRTCYTFYAPLPNPLQFKYLSNSYEILDPKTGKVLENLPYKGKANMNFYMTASAEYSYYWIRRMGTQAGRQNPGGSVYYTPNENTWKYDYSNYVDGMPGLGDGIVGYLVYEIPKGMGGYRINLPRVNPNDPYSAFDISKIVQVKTPRAKSKDAPANPAERRQRFKQMMDEMDFQPWEAIHHNDNTQDSIRIIDNGVKYSIWIPQLLIPPSLDDDDNDGVDDWIDDEGDRFYNSRNHAYLHDAIPIGTGYRIDSLMWAGVLDSLTQLQHGDDDMGYSTQGWYHGGDKEWGDDMFEELGKIYFKINAEYEGKGKEGPVTISRGGTLVTEEIFGGSPWVVYSHVLSGWAEGVDIRLESWAVPYAVRFGDDTVLHKSTITDLSEFRQTTEQNPDGSYETSYNLSDPAHRFDDNFDPFHLTKGYDKGEATITTYVGGKDPCSVIEPTENINLSAIINPAVKKTVTLVPMAAGEPTLAAMGYPKQLSNKSLVQIKVEFTNNSPVDWRNVKLATLIPDSLKNSLSVEMEYLAYPRPLVPNDDIGGFNAGWRFNEPEGEVLIKMGNELPLIQPPRRAYYLVLLSVSDNLPDGVYELNFSMTADKCSPVTRQPIGTISYTPPRALISIQRSGTTNPIVLGQSKLDSLVIVPRSADAYRPFGAAKLERVYTNEDAATTLAGYDKLTETLPVMRGTVSKFDLSALGAFPSLQNKRIRVVEKAAITCVNGNATVENITSSQRLSYTLEDGTRASASSGAVSVSTRGPKVVLTKKIKALNGKAYADGDVLSADADGRVELALLVTAKNRGLSADNVRATYTNEGLFVPNTERIAQSCPTCQVAGSSVDISFGTMMSGSEKSVTLYYSLNTAELLGADAENGAAAKSLAPKATAAALKDQLLVVRSGSVRFDNSSDSRRYSYVDKNATQVTFYELKPVDVSMTAEKIALGKATEFVATIKNYAYPVQNVPVSIYAVSETDTLLLCTGTISRIDMGGTATISLQHTFADARMVQEGKLQLMLRVNANANSSAVIPELVYDNDSRFFDAEVGIPDMVDDGKLVIFPNPAVAEVNFVYDECQLPVAQIEACLYSGKSGKLACHVGKQCEVRWDLPEIKPGVYAVRIEVTLLDGSKKQYVRRLAVGS